MSHLKLWVPLPCRVNMNDMHERLRGKRLVFAGDLLDRNMWESLLYALRNSVKDTKKEIRMPRRQEFRTKCFYSFLFKVLLHVNWFVWLSFLVQCVTSVYRIMVELFQSPFLVREWEMLDNKGYKKETIRLDIVKSSSSKCKDVHVIVFNIGHRWTNEKTFKE